MIFFPLDIGGSFEKDAFKSLICSRQSPLCHSSASPSAKWGSFPACATSARLLSTIVLFKSELLPHLLCFDPASSFKFLDVFILWRFCEKGNFSSNFISLLETSEVIRVGLVLVLMCEVGAAINLETLSLGRPAVEYWTQLYIESAHSFVWLSSNYIRPNSWLWLPAQQQQQPAG